jgi:hypothetical protein
MMPKQTASTGCLTTWDGARREQLRHWSQMPLAEMILALEEMQVLAEKLSRSSP